MQWILTRQRTHRPSRSFIAKNSTVGIAMHPFSFKKALLPGILSIALFETLRILVTDTSFSHELGECKSQAQV
jgi:hypothetical protein